MVLIGTKVGHIDTKQTWAQRPGSGMKTPVHESISKPQMAMKMISNLWPVR